VHRHRPSQADSKVSHVVNYFCGGFLCVACVCKCCCCWGRVAMKVIHNIIYFFCSPLIVHSCQDRIRLHELDMYMYLLSDAIDVM
jgi:hypothetical protein